VTRIVRPASLLNDREVTQNSNIELVLVVLSCSTESPTTDAFMQ
jgi:hypothetical protein